MSSTPFIGAEEFYLSHDIPITSTSASTSPLDPALQLVPPALTTKLKNVGPSRIREMRASGIAVQILSHITIDASPKQCAKLNDTLHSSIITNQDRFKALALLPCWDAKEAASELQRCVTKGFVGGVLGFRRGAWEGKVWEGEGYEELWKCAERYKVPIALKPLFPTRDQISEYEGGYPGQIPPSIVGPLVTHFYGFHAASPLLLLRLYISGVFDRHPNLRLILSQNGHSVASLLPRVESFLSTIPGAYRPHRRFLDVWQHNIYITTADTLDIASMRALLEQIPVDRVLFAANYPWEEKGKVLMNELRDSGIVGQEEWERIGWRNAEYLFGLGSDKGRPAVGVKRRNSFG